MSGRPRGPAREQLLQAADTMFGTLGFDATTTRGIEECSGVTKGLIHYHFKGKQDLFNTVLDRYYAALDRMLRSRLTGDGTVRERFWQVIDAYFDFLEHHQNFSRMVQREITVGRHVDRIVAHMRPLLQLGVALAAQAYPAARTGPLAAPQLLVSFYGMVVAWFSYAPVVESLLGADVSAPEMQQQRKQHLRQMLDLVLDALESSTDDRRKS